MVDKEVERAVIAAFEDVLSGRVDPELPLNGLGGADQSGTARELETLAHEVHRISTGPEYLVTNTPTLSENMMPPGSVFAEPAAATVPSTLSSVPRASKSPPEEEHSSVASSIVQTVLKTGLGTVPLIRLVAGLFGGDDAEAPPPLLKYAAPPVIRQERANGDSRDGRLAFSEFDYDQEGHLRRLEAPATESARSMLQEATAMTERDTTRATQITVNVQAIDSRSFLDHSNDIALAVREAMLNMHSLNDIVSEL